MIQKSIKNGSIMAFVSLKSYQYSYLVLLMHNSTIFINAGNVLLHSEPITWFAICYIFHSVYVVLMLTFKMRCWLLEKGYADLQ